MKRGTLLLVWTFLLGIAVGAAGQGPNDSGGRTLITGRPVKFPGLEPIKQLPESPDDIAPPDRQPKKAIDADAARRNARELADLAQKIPRQVDLATQNILSKDLVQQLKHIEKLAKRLRRDLAL